MEKPSAKKFANPRISTIEGERDVQMTPANTAKVVTVPSVAP